VVTVFGLALAGLVAYSLLWMALEGKTLLAEGRFFIESVYRRI